MLVNARVTRLNVSVKLLNASGQLVIARVANSKFTFASGKVINVNR